MTQFVAQDSPDTGYGFDPSMPNVTNEARLMSECWKHADAVDDIIKSYEHFIEEGINDVLVSYPLIFNRVDEDGRSIPFRRFRLTLIKAVPPMMGEDEFITPEYAHLNNLTLMSSMVAQLSMDLYDDVRDEWNEVDTDTVDFGKVPTMVRSKYCNTGGLTNRQLYEIGECPTWPGGYFIAKGNMSTITMKMKLRENRFLIYRDSTLKEVVGTIISSVSTGTTKLSLYQNKQYGIVMWSNFIRYVNGSPSPISIFYVLAVLHKFVYGLTEFNKSDFENIIDDIIRYIPQQDRNKALTHLRTAVGMMRAARDNYNILIENLLMYCNLTPVHTELDLLGVIRQSLFSQFNSMIEDGRMSVEEADEYRYYELCYFIGKYVEYMIGVRTLDDRNNISYCKFETPGIALRSLFHDIYKTNVMDLYESTTTSIPDMNNMRQFVNKVSVSITKQLESSIRSNTWGAKKGTQRQNMVERVRLDTVLLLYSEVTKITTPTSKQGNQLAARENHQSQCGYIDYVNSPESDACGLTNHKAVTCQFSLNRPDDIILDYITDKIISPVDARLMDLDEDPEVSRYPDYIFVNGKFMGLGDGPVLKRELIEMRRNGELPFDTMIAYDRSRNEFYAHTDGGRAVRPLLIVNPDTNNLVINEKNLWNRTFNRLMREHAVEYIDAAEQEYAMVSTSPTQLIIDKYLRPNMAMQYSHSELDPNAVLGVSAACIPIANHNMSTKNCYAANMMQQGIGTPGINYYNRFDTKSLVMDAPTRPIFEPQFNRLLGLSQLPFGRGIIVAYMAYNGFNQEDAIIVNKGSLDRGVFNYGIYYKYDFEESFHANNVQVRIQELTQAQIDEIPVYRGLGLDGIIKVGSRVKAGDVLVRARRLTKQTATSTTVQAEDMDVRVKYGEYGTVRRVEISDVAGRRVIKIRIEDQRNVLNSIDFIGDKLSSRAATKGVIGVSIDEKMIPYTQSGLRPDLIINPLGVPTRGPVNKLIEILTGKGHVMIGRRVDATSFKSPRFAEKKSQEYLKRFGLNEDGEEMMIDPMTGKTMGMAFIGPCHYMMLTHYAVDKIQGQGQIGRKIIATNQPRKGRKNEGGIRFGEGERDALVAYSNSTLVHDTMCKSSDSYTCIMCIDCGKETALQPLPDQNPSCVNCGGENLRAQTLSGAYKYLTYMTTGLNVNITHTIQ